jgi:hypothetical protein
MICPHMNPETGEVCCLYFLHNAKHRDAHGTEWGARGPHDMPVTRDTDALWRAQHRAALREPQGSAVRLFEPAPATMPGQAGMVL